MNTVGIALAPLFLFAASCAREHPPARDEPSIAHLDEGIKLRSDSPTLDYFKLEVVKDSTGGTVITLPGKVAFEDDHTQRVSSPIDGRVRAVLARLGEKVKKGQTLLELASPQVVQLQADASKGEQDLAVSEKARERSRRLRSDGAISEKELTQIEADYNKARSEVARTTAQLQALGLKAGQPTTSGRLIAAIDGTVVERNVLVGQEVRSDSPQPLLTVSDLDHLWVLGDLYEQDLSLVKVGSVVRIHVPAHPGKVYPGKIQYIGDLVDPQSRTVKVRCDVINDGRDLKPDMFAQIEVEDSTGNKSLLVPARAVLSNGAESQVVISASGGVLKLRKVEVGPEVGGQVRVVSGLSPGEVIVTDGALFVRQEIQDN